MFYLKLFTDIPVPGVTAVVLSISIFSGVQIFLIGILGEYIARIFEEVSALMKAGLRSPKWRGIDSKDTLSIFGLYDSVEKVPLRA